MTEIKIDKEKAKLFQGFILGMRDGIHASKEIDPIHLGEALEVLYGKYCELIGEEE